MKKEIKEIIEIPEGIEAEIKDKVVTIKKGEDILTRKFLNEFKIEKQDKKLILHCPNATKKDKKLIKTAYAHISNMLKGLQNKFVYELKVCFVHFPITVELKGNEIIVKNFLGERIPRKAKILPGVEVTIDKDTIKVSSYDKEKAGQTAANIETATKIRYRDRTVFQDGIFIIKKEKGRKEK